MPPRTLGLAVAFGLLVAGACRGKDTGIALGGTDPQPTPAAFTRANDLRAPETLPRCTVGADPILQVGVLEGERPYELGEVPSATRLRDGGIAVVNRSTDEVRVYDSAGRYRHALGRQGKGPGEFEDPIFVASFGGDSLLVWDWDLQRIVVFDPLGKLLRTISVRPVVGNPLDWMIASSSAGPYWVGSAGVGTRRPLGEEIVAESLEIVRVNGTGASFPTPVRLLQRRWKWVNESWRMSGQPIFDRHASVAAAPGGFFVADGLTPTIELRDSSWALRGTIRWTEASRRITDVDVERYKNAVLARARSGKSLWLQTWAKVPVADSFSSVDELIPGKPSGVWAKRPWRGADTAETWWGFTERGEFRCTVALPRPFRVREFGPDWVIGVSETESGMHQVQVLSFAVRR